MSEAAVRNFGLAQANSRAQHTEHNAARMFEAQIQAIIDNPVSQKAMAFILRGQLCLGVSILSGDKRVGK